MLVVEVRVVLNVLGDIQYETFDIPALEERGKAAWNACAIQNHRLRFFGKRRELCCMDDGNACARQLAAEIHDDGHRDALCVQDIEEFWQVRIISEVEEAARRFFCREVSETVQIVFFVKVRNGSQKLSHDERFLQ